jgi:hypothetical protein
MKFNQIPIKFGTKKNSFLSGRLLLKVKPEEGN